VVPGVRKELVAVFFKVARSVNRGALNLAVEGNTFLRNFGWTY
jgi:hypothetical protein